MASPSSRPASHPCPRCGALNGAGFDRCIRCGQPLGVLAKSADRVAQPIDAARMPATTAFGAICILVFVGQAALALQRGETPGFLGLSTMGQRVDALRCGAMIAAPVAVLEEPFRLVSAVFVHFGVLHIGMNLLGLANLSRLAEPAFGSARYAIGLVLTGAVGFAATVVATMFEGTPTVTAGASGAVFGAMGMILGFLVRRRDPRWKTFAVQAVFYSVLFGFAVNASNAGIMVNNSAHLGGLASGFALGWIFTQVRVAPRRSELWANVGAGGALVATIVSLVMSQRSPLWQDLLRLGG